MSPFCRQIGHFGQLWSFPEDPKTQNNLGNMVERATGIEPAFSAWEGVRLNDALSPEAL